MITKEELQLELELITIINQLSVSLEKTQDWLNKNSKAHFMYNKYEKVCELLHRRIDELLLKWEEMMQKKEDKQNESIIN